jgi:hypothetical protein
VRRPLNSGTASLVKGHTGEFLVIYRSFVIAALSRRYNLHPFAILFALKHRIKPETGSIVSNVRPVEGFMLYCLHVSFIRVGGGLYLDNTLYSGPTST